MLGIYRMRNGAIWIIVRGGLGNQMFQVAFGTALAVRFGLCAKYVDLIARDGLTRKWELACFGISAQRLPGWANTAFRLLLSAQRRLGPTALGHLPGVWMEDQDSTRPFPRTDAPRIVSGYWQNPQLFEDVEYAVRKQFCFPDLPEGCELSPAVQWRPKVAIHVRRGDYADTPAARQLRLVCGPDWYRAAWQEMRNRLGACHAFVFSDDVHWVKKEINFDGAVDYVDFDPSEDAWVDMARMSSCDHFIISNSSYSWWAAFLSTSACKVIIAPRLWIGGRDTARAGICPSSWVLL
jgi:hypothetical protein